MAMALTLMYFTVQRRSGCKVLLANLRAFNLSGTKKDDSAVAKVLVLYDSQTGNTAQMAELVAEGAASVAGVEVRLRSVDVATADDVLWCDGLAVGSPTNMGLLSWKMKRFWDETMADSWMKVDGRVACAFSSSGGWGGGAELACQSILTVLLNFGFLVFGVTDYVAKLMTLHYGAVACRAPAAATNKPPAASSGFDLPSGRPWWPRALGGTSAAKKRPTIAAGVRKSHRVEPGNAGLRRKSLEVNW